MTRDQVDAYVVATLCGRAADELFGSATTGAGGPTSSDLGLATATLAAAHASLGLGGSLLHRADTQMDPRVADRVVHFSERHAAPAAVRDAKLIRACHRENRPGDDAVVRRLAETLLGTVTVGDLVRASGLAGAGFRAVVRAIGDGVLAVRGPAGIGYATRVALVEPVDGGR